MYVYMEILVGPSYDKVHWERIFVENVTQISGFLQSLEATKIEKMFRS